MTRFDLEYIALVLSRRMAVNDQRSVVEDSEFHTHALHSEIVTPRKVFPVPEQ